ncbi:MAG: hypothetical protein K2X87_11335 [Gemmataceae bacterium]|nr:hypothetical protein [Gemmataceae bacterium]
MSPDDVLTAKRKVPFVPFRIIASDGRTFDVRMPDRCMVLPHTVIVGVMRREDDELPERLAYIHPSQLRDLVPLDQPANRAPGS